MSQLTMSLRRRHRMRAEGRRPGVRGAVSGLSRVAGAAVLAAVLAAALPAGGAKAALFNLQNLISSGGSITAGDKRFSGFSCTITPNTGIGIAGPAACGQISVLPIESAPLGLTFQSSFVAQNGALKDVLLGYSVDVLDPNQKIHGIGLTYNGFIFGQAITQVTETVMTPDGTVVGNAAVVTSDTTSVNQDMVVLDGSHSSLKVLKDVLLGSATSAVATISFIDQRFDQDVPRPPVTQVPEPAALAAVGAGLLGFGLIRRQRRASGAGR